MLGDVDGITAGSGIEDGAGETERRDCEPKEERRLCDVGGFMGRANDAGVPDGADVSAHTSVDEDRTPSAPPDLDDIVSLLPPSTSVRSPDHCAVSLVDVSI